MFFPPSGLFLLHRKIGPHPDYPGAGPSLAHTPHELHSVALSGPQEMDRQS